MVMRAVFGGLLLCICLPSWADAVYRWTDASGAVSYGQRPPPGALAVRRVDVEPANVFPARDVEADQKLAEAYTKARSERLQQEATESRIAADKARADLDRQTAMLDAQRAQAEAACASSYQNGCGDNGAFYYPIVGARGYGAYNARPAGASGASRLPPQGRPRPAPLPLHTGSATF